MFSIYEQTVINYVCYKLYICTSHHNVTHNTRNDHVCYNFILIELKVLKIGCIMNMIAKHLKAVSNIRPVTATDRFKWFHNEKFKIHEQFLVLYLAPTKKGQMLFQIYKFRVELSKIAHCLVAVSKLNELCFLQFQGVKSLRLFGYV